MQMTTKQGIYLLVDDLLFILTVDYFPMQGMFCHILIKIPLQSVPITTTVVNSNSAHDEVYRIQLYVIKLVSDLQQVCGFLRVDWFPPPIKLTSRI